MLGRVLLDDADFQVTIGLLGAVRVTLKSRGMTLKALGSEKAHLLAVIEVMKHRGVPIEPGSPMLLAMLRLFAQAVWGRGEAHWTVFFQRSPQFIADMFLNVGEHD